MSPGAIVRYRKKAAKPYEAWNVELARLATLLDQVTPADLEKDLQRIIDAKVAPQLLKHKNEMAKIRDELFGDVIKKVATWEVATVSLAYAAALSFSQGLVACAAVIAPAVPGLVDYITARRAVKRENALAYLISATPDRR